MGINVNPYLILYTKKGKNSLDNNIMERLTFYFQTTMPKKDQALCFFYFCLKLEFKFKEKTYKRKSRI